MISHFNISRWNIVEELERLDEAGKEVLFIIPESINMTKDLREERHWGAVETFQIIFRDKTGVA